MYPEKPILIIDDEVSALQSFELTLNSAQIDNIVLCQDSRKVIKILSQQQFDLILLDLTMPYITGEELLKLIIQEYPDIPVIIITGNIEIETAIKCMKSGAFDYLIKPVEDKRLISSVRHGLKFNNLQRENITLKQQLLYDKELEFPEAFSKIITQNKSMISIFKYIEVIARSPEPILLTGETGVGKELIAQSIHIVSRRRGTFIPINVSGLDDSMFSDTLFGHRKGAFTDAYQSRQGLIEQATDGTLFLDEIGDLNLASQIKLLRILQEKEYFQLGSDIPNYSNALFIAATNQNLDQLMANKRFRKDLFYRLKVHHVNIPPLRMRSNDIPLLTNHFLHEAAQSLNRKTPSVPKELYILLKNYPFYGNIRELRSMVYNAVSSSTSGIISLKSFKEAIDHHQKTSDFNGEIENQNEHFTLKFTRPLPSLKQMETELIKEAMKEAEDNQTIAANILGITRQTLNKKLRIFK